MRSLLLGMVCWGAIACEETRVVDPVAPPTEDVPVLSTAPAAAPDAGAPDDAAPDASDGFIFDE